MGFPLSIKGETLIANEPSRPGRRERVIQAVLALLRDEQVRDVEADGTEIRFRDHSMRMNTHPLACFRRGRLNVTESADGYAIRYELSLHRLVIWASLFLLIFPLIIGMAEGWRAALVLGPFAYAALWLIMVGGNAVIGRGIFHGWLRRGVRNHLAAARAA